LVLFEIQQNSDTTYRVFDWNRVDDQGKPRQLHLEQSLQCIDFLDFEPEPLRPDSNAAPENEGVRQLVNDSLFSVDEVSGAAGGGLSCVIGEPRIICVVAGGISIAHKSGAVEMKAGEFCLLPAELGFTGIGFTATGKFLLAQPGSGL
jgi:mannose-6-phosphate isomerase